MENRETFRSQNKIAHLKTPRKSIFQNILKVKKNLPFSVVSPASKNFVPLQNHLQYQTGTQLTEWSKNRVLILRSWVQSHDLKIFWPCNVNARSSLQYRQFPLSLPHASTSFFKSDHWSLLKKEVVVQLFFGGHFSYCFFMIFFKETLNKLARAARENF